MKRILFAIIILAMFNHVNAQCWKEISAGQYHSIGIKSNGTIWSCGNNNFGQLGNGTTIDSNFPNQIGNDNNWESISTFYSHSLATKKDGTLWAWGAGNNGQLGNGTQTDANIPTQIGNNSNWKSISAGKAFSMTIKTDGTLWAWGINNYAQLGDGTTITKTIPIQITTDTNWKTISAGYTHTLAIKTDGTLWAWGDNGFGQLGNGTQIDLNIPTQIGNDNNWQFISSGWNYSLAIKTDGSLWAWGRNESGQLGDGTTIKKTNPTQITLDTNWKSVSANDKHSLAIKTNGTLWAWGNNQFGQIGNNSTNLYEPNPIQIDNSTDWMFISTGEGHSLSIKTDGTLWAWGANGLGELGDSTNTDKHIPTVIDLNSCQCTSTKNSSFNYSQSNNLVSFLNTTLDDTSSFWAFGDGNFSNIRNPIHKYNAVGNYNAKLISKFNDSCTLGLPITQVISITTGLISIQSNRAGDSSAVTVTLKGTNFSNGMQVYLRKSGQDNIYGDSIKIIDSSTILLGLDLTGKALGLWDVVGIYQNGDTSILKDAFTIEHPLSKLWVDLKGQGILRIGFNQIYTVTIGNDGNQDAVLVPLVIKGLPIGTEIELINPLFKFDSLMHFDTLQITSPPINSSIVDSLTNTSMRIFYITKIPAGSTQTLSFIFHVPTTTKLHTYPNIEAILLKPELNSKDGLLHKALSVESAECSAKVIEVTSNKLADLATKLLSEPIQKWVNCARGAADLVQTGLEQFSKEAPPFTLIDGVKVVKGTIETALNCGSSIVSTFFPEKIVADLVLKSALIMYDESKYIAGLGYLLIGHDLYQSCTPAYKQETKKRINPIIGNAYDPNDKYGPGCEKDGHYINTYSPIGYTISFENEPSANLNAQTISVIDTLNPAYYDFSTFRFTSVILGDSTYTLHHPSKSFFHDFEIANQFGVKARVTGIFDSKLGIINWRFLSIDTATNQQTTDALLGILPPDVNSPKGQGYVSYAIEPNKNITTGDIICNKASIIFDNNPAINTPCWENTFDLIKPQSTVTTLPSNGNMENFSVNWSGTDNLSGVYYYDVYVSVNDSSFILWKSETETLVDTFYGHFGNKYSFYSIATDKAGNTELGKSNSETSTYITSIKKGNSSITAYPNPTKGICNIDIETKIPNTITLHYVDLLGHTLLSIKKSIVKGMNKFEIDLSGFETGNYLLKVDGLEINPIKISYVQ